jgi:hypothetical protein
VLSARKFDFIPRIGYLRYLALAGLVILFVSSVVKIGTISLSEAKESPLPLAGFGDRPFTGYRFDFITHAFLTLVAVFHALRKSESLLVAGTVGATTTIAWGLLGGSLIARATDYWPSGLAIAFVISGFTGACYLGIQLGRQRQLDLPNSIVARAKMSIIGVLSVVGALYFLAIPIRNYFFWDYVGQEGRFAMQSALLFSQFPIGSFTYADEPLRYHIGFDGSVAGVSALAGIALDRSNILLGLTLMTLCFACLRVLIDIAMCESNPHVTHPKNLMTVVALFSGGVPFYFGVEDLNRYYTSIFPNTDFRGLWILPPFTSYFFQRAFAIGIPLFLSALILAHLTGTRRGRRMTHFITLGVLTASLAIANTTLAVTLIVFGSMRLIVEMTRLIRCRITNTSPTMTSLLGSTVIVAVGLSSMLLLNGFLSGTSSRVEGRSALNGFGLGVCGHTDSCAAWLRWLILSFGFALFGVFWIRRYLTPMLTVLAGVLIGFFLEFKGSPDEVKFAVVPRMLLGVALVLGVSARFHQSHLVIRSTILVSLAVLLTSAGITFLSPLVTDAPLKGISKLANLESAESVASPPIQLVNLAKRLDGDNGFVCSPELVNYCGTYGGLRQFKQDVISKQLYGDDLTRTLDAPMTSTFYIESGFLYLIVSESEPTWWSFSDLTMKSNRGSLISEISGFRLIRFSR